MAKLSPQAHSFVRGAVDYGGLVVFLIGFAITRNLVQATWWLVAGSAAALILGFAIERRIAPMPLIAGGAALLFGALTLIFNDPSFIKLKPTIMNTLFGVTLLGGVMLGKNPLKWFLGSALVMSEGVWRTFTFRYGLFFLACAVINEIVWRTQPDAVWVLFRFPGLLILALAFSVTQTPLIMRGMKEAGHVPTEEEKGPPPPPLVE
ncbi:MAG: inner membrane-spanning protein YciB [Caulobacter sp.]